MRILGPRPDPQSETGGRKQKGLESELEVYKLIEKTEIPGGMALTDYKGLTVTNDKGKKIKATTQNDFFLFLPGGAMVVEVKTNHVRSSEESGWKQASGYAHAWLNKLIELLGSSNKAELPSLGWGVVYVEHDSGQLDRIAAAVDDRSALLGNECLKDPALFANWLHERIGKAAGSLRNHKGSWLPGEIEDLLGRCNGDANLRRTLAHVDERIEALTSEQAGVLEKIILREDRFLFEGGAGTGKTAIAIVGATEEARQGREVLLMTSTDLQRDFMNRKIPGEFSDKITVATPDRLEGMLNGGMGPWKTLFVDEGQDMLQLEILDLLDRAIAGGLSDGIWFWFMDAQNQSGVFGALEPDVLELLYGYLPRARNGVKKERLGKNLRNTRTIVDFVEDQLAADVGEGSDIIGDAIGVQWQPDTDAFPESCKCWLEKRLIDLNEQFDSRVFLIDISRSPGKDLSHENWFYYREIESRLSRRFRTMIKIHNSQNDVAGVKFMITNPERVKGLECDHALILGDSGRAPESPEDHRFIAAGMYVAMTRARHSFSFFLPSSWRDIQLEREGGHS